MDAYVFSAATSLLIPAAYLLVTTRRQFWRAVLLWLVWPIVIYCIVVAWEMLTKAPGPSAFSDALLGFSLLSAILILPWLLFSTLVLGLAVAIRTVFRGPEPSPAKPERVMVPQEPIAQYEAGYAGERKVSDGRKQTSPDGSIEVEFEPVEWYNNLWMFPPRITDVNSGDVVLDAWGQDWDVRVEFPGHRQVVLECSRYSGAAFKTVLDLERASYQILHLRGVEGPFPHGPLSEAKHGLDAACHRSAEAVYAYSVNEPQIASPKASFKTALVVSCAVLTVVGIIGFWAERTVESDPIPKPIIAVPEGGFRPTDDDLRRCRSPPAVSC